MPKVFHNVRNTKDVIKSTYKTSLSKKTSASNILTKIFKLI